MNRHLDIGNKIGSPEVKFYINGQLILKYIYQENSKRKGKYFQK